jgi:hypothetical protein
MLFGAAMKMLDDLGAQLWPSNRADYDRNLAAARTALAPDAFQAAWERGQTMTAEEAVDFALGVKPFQIMAEPEFVP